MVPADADVLEPHENLWDYDAVEPGQEGHPTVVALTPEHIALYALAAQNRDARFQKAGTNAEYEGALVANADDGAHLRAPPQERHRRA